MHSSNDTWPPATTAGASKAGEGGRRGDRSHLGDGGFVLVALPVRDGLPGDGVTAGFHRRDLGGELVLIEFGFEAGLTDLLADGPDRFCYCHCVHLPPAGLGVCPGM